LHGILPETSGIFGHLEKIAASVRDSQPLLPITKNRGAFIIDSTPDEVMPGSTFEPIQNDAFLETLTKDCTGSGIGDSA
jgi:hypothetical protein